jgi:hypothetical protein
MLPFNISKIFILSLKLSTFTFILLWGTICLLGGRLSQNEGQRNTRQITQELKHTALPESLCVPTELWNACGNLKFLFLKFLLVIYFWLCLVKTVCTKSANKVGLLFTLQEDASTQRDVCKRKIFGKWAVLLAFCVALCVFMLTWGLA